MRVVSGYGNRCPYTLLYGSSGPRCQHWSIHTAGTRLVVVAGGTVAAEDGINAHFFMRDLVGAPWSYERDLLADIGPVGIPIATDLFGHDTVTMKGNVMVRRVTVYSRHIDSLVTSAVRIATLTR